MASILAYAVTPGTFADFVEHVVPELRRRGRAQSEYAAPDAAGEPRHPPPARYWPTTPRRPPPPGLTAAALRTLLGGGAQHQVRLGGAPCWAPRTEQHAQRPGGDVLDGIGRSALIGGSTSSSRSVAVEPVMAMSSGTRTPSLSRC